MASRKILIIFLSSLTVISFLLFLFFPEDYCNFKESRITVNGSIISVALSSTPTAMKRGLSNCPRLPKKHGMLFVYNPPQSPVFWMKDMLFPLDMVWISGNKVIGINANIPIPIKGQPLKLYAPPEPVSAVLEINVGEAGQLDIKSGSEVIFNTSS